MGHLSPFLRPGAALLLCVGLAACGEFDFDFRNLGDGLDTSEAALTATADRPRPDDRGVISYPNYQVVVAQRGETVGDVADRLGLDGINLASFNGLPPDAPLRDGEVIALPARVPEPSPATGAIGTGPILPAGEVDVAALAGAAIDRAGETEPALPPGAQVGVEPVRHRVVRGETAFTIARLYNVSVTALAEWNGLGANLDVREGQYLLIPVVIEPAVAAAPLPPVAPTTAPGTGSATPEPPSASQPLPVATAPESRPTPEPVTAAPLADDRTAASDTAQLLLPVNGSIIRPFDKGTNDGIGIGAPEGTPVVAADAGTVAAITRDTDQVPIVVLRHEDNLLTVYAGVDAVTVEKGDAVTRGQPIAAVRNGSPSFVHFEVRDGFESVDPMPYLN
ncbi:MAG: peptidoglycan DD-metalloendopeptidase family protein [Pseudomonadota bacterium]